LGKLLSLDILQAVVILYITKAWIPCIYRLGIFSVDYTSKFVLICQSKTHCNSGKCRRDSFCCSIFCLWNTWNIYSSQGQSLFPCDDIQNIWHAL